MEEVLPVVLKLVIVVAGLAGLASALRETILKYRSRSDLAKALGSNQEDVARVNVLLTQNKIDDAVDVLRKYIGELPKDERANAESALSQRSQRGRAAYIRVVSHPRAVEFDKLHSGG
jgi:hypothetical protein